MVSVQMLWMAIVISPILHLSVNSAPAAIDMRKAIDPYEVCTSVNCRYGAAKIDMAVNACVCPTRLGEDLRDPCEDLLCPYGQGPAFSWMTNKCVCADICELQSCPNPKMSTFSTSSGACACVLDCRARIQCPTNTEAEYNFENDSCFCAVIEEDQKSFILFHQRLEREWEARQANASINTTTSSVAHLGASTDAATNETGAANFTLLPPPKTEITLALIQQSLNLQPYSLAG